MARVSRSEKKLGTVTTSLDQETHSRFTALAESRGMTMRALAARFVRWFDRLDISEQAIVLEQIARDDAAGVAELVLRRKADRDMSAVVESALGPTKVPRADERKVSKAG